MLWFFVLVALHEQELAWVGAVNPEVSVNKAPLGCSALVSRCDVEQWFLGILDVLLWRETELGKLKAIPVNKHRQDLVALPPLLFAASGHHGGGSWAELLEAIAWGG